jgi:3-dehydroquinate dehydratase/shikimate dehydrogenase
LERTAHLIATASRLPMPEEVDALPSGVDWLEVRADRVAEAVDDPVGGSAADRLRALRERLGGGLIHTLRSRAEGGDGPDEPAARAEALIRAGREADLWDLVDLEAERDLHPSVLEAVAPERRILSWHGPPRGRLSPDDLAERFATMERTPARLYKLIPAAHQPGEELAPLRLLGALERDDVIAFAAGPSGVWTRLLAPRLGAPVVYGAFPGHDAGAPGQPRIDRLVTDYGLPELPPADALFGVIGRPVDHSLSPRLHNRAYRELGIRALYLAFHAEHFGDFWLEVVEGGILEALGFPLLGLSVTTPYKEAALAIAGAPSPRAAAIGAANTLVQARDGSGVSGVWEAESTDPEGVVLPLRELRVELDGTEALVVGAGGAGRSAVVGLREAGARVTLANRTEDRGRRAAEALGVRFVPLAELTGSGGEGLTGYRIVVHATSLGRSPEDPLPFDPAALDPAAVVVDLVYTDRETSLLGAAREAGCTAVDGREVLLSQALEQFRMMTGRELPAALAHRALDMSPAGLTGSGDGMGSGDEP